MSDQNQSPSLASLLREQIESRVSGINVALPGRVTSYDTDSRRATVKPLVQMARVNPDTGQRTAVSLPVITEVPIMMYGSGGVRVKIPVHPGDTGLLIFCSASIDRWLRFGGEVDPGDSRQHDLTDAIFLPGLQSFAEDGDADPMIEFTESGEIHAGGSDKLATKADVDAIYNAISSAAVSAGDGGAAFKAAILSSLSTFLATNGTSVLKGS
jgi:hypothetical protein